MSYHRLQLLFIMKDYSKPVFILPIFALLFLCDISVSNAFFAHTDIPAETNASGMTKETLIAIMQKYRVIGMNYLVVSKGEICGFGCFGYADVERKIPMRKTTIFRIASISKPIVAAALIQLVEKKKCRPDDDIGNYLGFKVRNPHHRNRIITLRHLLTHTSSLCDEGRYDVFLRASYSDAPPPLSSILEQEGIYSSKKNWKAHQPGKKFHYSNLGYGIIATIIEKISHMRFDEYCKKYIFQPLGMNGSFNVDDFENVDDFAVLYSHYSEEEKKKEEFKRKKEFEASMDAYRGVKPKKKNFTGWKPGFNALIHSPQGGARISMVDLAKFMIALMGDGSIDKKNRILLHASVREMRKIHWSGTLHNGLHRKTGLGLTITKNLIKGETLYGHSGRAYGFQGMMYYNPAKKYGIIILMNGGDYYKDEEEPVEFHNIELELFRLLHERYIESK